MPEKITKLQRWLDLIAYLVGRRYPVTVDEIMEHVPAYGAGLASETGDASVRRMFERDKDELREIGIPIETVDIPEGGGAEPSQGYRIARGDFYLPYLELIGAAEEGPGEGPPTGPEPAIQESHANYFMASPAHWAKRSVSKMWGVKSLEVRGKELRAARDALERVAELPSFPLRREARSALLKLAFDVPPPASAHFPVLVVERPDAEALRERLRTLSDALRRRKRVRFRYHGIYRGEDTERDVAAYGLLFQRGHWYLIGHDRLRDAVRIFRVDRMESEEPNRKTPKRADYEIPGDFDLAGYRNRQAWELAEPEEETIQARVSFRFPASLWVDRNGYGERLEQRPDGSSVRRFEVRQVNPFLRWMLSLAGEAEILAPIEIREAFAEMTREVASLYKQER